MINSGLFTSNTGKWDTPQTLVDDLAKVFDWDCDVCADRHNVCDFYYDEIQDGLKQDWHGLCWMNPPYGREIGKWVDKARTESKKGATVVCLLPARTDTHWWHRNIRFASTIVFIRGRLRFGGATNSAPFPSAFVVFGGLTDKQIDKLSSYGWALT